MSKGFKITLLVFFIVIVTGSIIAYNMFTKPRRDVANEKGMVITASQLVNEYQQSESSANAKYLNKPIEVKGTITEVSQNQEGKTTVQLATDDAMTGVFCTLKEKNTNLSAGNKVTIKGICNGMMSDVRISEAIVVQ